MIGQPPRYALDEPVFPFPALVSATAKAALGGAREVRLACLMAGRMAVALLPPYDIAVEAHAERSAAARHWLSTLTLPPDVRAATQRVLEPAGRADLDSTAAALDGLLGAVGASLDQASRAELSRVAERLADASEREAAGVAQVNELQAS